MGGQNPFLKDAAVPPPTRAYTLKIIDAHGREHVIAVDPAALPRPTLGRPGSILDLATANGVELDHACGGLCACATCHVIVRAGLDTCNELSDDEEDQLDEAYGLTVNSRLACQCVPDGTSDVVVEIPAWNRNLAREAEH
ncbi:MAG TPA: 2Fe-2S iron-sulfur cluster-binding protein [Phycisphaerae bacterium]|nr:2Fe-2S iron-sulfur cluster-binding protein [Phycisphaerae bacterium]